MVDSGKVGTRSDAAQRYLNLLVQSKEQDWLELRREWTKDEEWINRLALIHPDHYKDLETYKIRCSMRGVCAVRGARNFSREMGRGWADCRSFDFWGYHCCLPRDAELAGDHVFPYSFGGPTNIENKRFLCPLHNAMKSSDIHIFPWELGEPAWLGAVLDAVTLCFA
jgi:hypothetical protein